MVWLSLLHFFFGFISAFLIYKYGQRFGLVDYPNERSSHYVPVPRGGGIGLILMLISLLVVNFPKSFVLPILIIALIGLASDIKDIPPVFRLLVQFFAVLLLFLSSAPWPNYHFLLMLLFSFFIVGTTNVYNFMDGINGLAAIEGIVAFGLLAFYLFRLGNHELLYLAMGCVFSCLGFLPFNIPKARVFMGDVGSILLGFIFALMVVILSENIGDFIVLSSFLFLFYADELTTMVVRLKRKESLSKPHRKHLYQILVNEKKIAHWKVSVFFGVAQLLIGLVVLQVKDDLPVLLLLALLLFIIFAFITYKVRLSLRGITLENTI